MIRFEREININELREVMAFAENQETTDKYSLDNEVIRIKGDYATIDVEVDAEGNFKVL